MTVIRFAILLLRVHAAVLDYIEKNKLQKEYRDAIYNGDEKLKNAALTARRRFVTIDATKLRAPDENSRT